MEEIRIIFWVCVVEAVIGHMPWTAPLAVFGVSILIALFVDRQKKKALEELDKSLENFKERSEKRKK